jgi:hypothetical protein
MVLLDGTTTAWAALFAGLRDQEAASLVDVRVGPANCSPVLFLR